MGKSTLKIDRYCPLVMQGFFNFLGLFQVIMANPGFDLFTKEAFDRLTGGTAGTSLPVFCWAQLFNFSDELLE